jgi:hypothetical protein
MCRRDGRQRRDLDGGAADDFGRTSGNTWSFGYEKASLRAVFRPRHQLVAGEPAPRRQLLVDGDLRRADLEQLARLQRVDVLANEQQQPVAAVEIAAVEGNVGALRMRIDGVHGAPTQ